MKIFRDYALDKVCQIRHAICSDRLVCYFLSRLYRKYLREWVRAISRGSLQNRREWPVREALDLRSWRAIGIKVLLTGEGAKCLHQRIGHFKTVHEVNG